MKQVNALSTAANKDWSESVDVSQIAAGLCTVGDRDVKPNLFKYATSELSQDAVLCWLAAWADPEAATHDPLLHRLGMRFLSAAFAACGKQLPSDLKKVEVWRQRYNIDILVEINGSIALCIEDKAGSVEHSGQLERYVETLHEKLYVAEAIVPVYIQTSNQSCFSGVKKAGYGILLRHDLMDILGRYVEQGGSNSIATDFYEHLRGIECWMQSFQDTPVIGWDAGAWQGFFSAVQSELGTGDWAYVPNAAGGFWAFYWAWRSDGETSQYLQLEDGRLTFRIEVGEGADRPELRSNWSERILEAGAELQIPVVRPARFGNGFTMTVAQLGGDYRVATDDGLLDLEATLRRIRMAESVMSRAASHCEAA